MRDVVINVKNLKVMLESFAEDSEFAIEITKGDGEVIITYDIGLSISEFNEFMFQVHE